MWRYYPKQPLARVAQVDPLQYWSCTNLLHDEKSNIIADNTTYVNTEFENHDPLVEDVEAILNNCCPNVELAYAITSGKRWIYLRYEGYATVLDCEHRQNAYEKTIMAARE